ncbi:unnamed protein product [Schistosoma margrebowiei]|uniref:Uncharacterized protein n=1 Tax=Schistosoma margrebowiei TaxID=48269 RepID=A0AA85ALC7_9TREM|nr:unnamed protein product [Schistosoma margrebowiei]
MMQKKEGMTAHDITSSQSKFVGRNSVKEFRNFKITTNHYHSIERNSILSSFIVIIVISCR